MPYYNRRRTYRRNGYRRRYPRKSTGGLDLIRTATAAYRGVKYLKGLVNVEKHALYTNGNNAVDNTTGVLNCLNLIAQGDLEANRTGDSVMMKMLHLNYKVQINASASHTAFRMILFLYKQPQGATPTIQFPLEAASHVSCYNNDNTGLYTILYDKTINLSIAGVQEKSLSVTRKFYQLHETFDGTTAAVGDIQTNALWMLMVSDEATNTPTCLWRSELLFIDN